MRFQKTKRKIQKTKNNGARQVETFLREGNGDTLARTPQESTRKQATQSPAKRQETYTGCLEKVASRHRRDVFVMVPGKPDGGR